MEKFTFHSVLILYPIGLMNGIVLAFMVSFIYTYPLCNIVQCYRKLGLWHKKTIYFRLNRTRVNTSQAVHNDCMGFN